MTVPATNPFARLQQTIGGQTVPTSPAVAGVQPINPLAIPASPSAPTATNPTSGVTPIGAPLNATTTPFQSAAPTWFQQKVAKINAQDSNGQPPAPPVSAPVAPTASTLPNREAIAQQYFNEMQTATDPAYQAAIRSATQAAAAQGSLGSGQLNTSYGNLALQRSQNLDTLQQQLQTQATEGTIGDMQTAIQQWLQETALQNQIAANQAQFMGSGANAKTNAAQQYGSQSAAAIKALQDMLASMGVQSGTNPTGG